MQKTLLYLGCLLVFCQNSQALSLTDEVLNNQKIIDLTNNYILLLQEAINQRSGNYLLNIDECFNNYIENDHTYDLGEGIEKMMVGAYLSDAKNNTQIVEFDALTEEMEVLPCTYFNPKTSKSYTYVKLPKIMIRQGNKKSSYSHYLSIDVTNANYFIDAIYKDDAATAQQFIAPCMQEQLDAEKQRQLAAEIEIMYEAVTNLYGETKYLEALIIIEEILVLNSIHQQSLDAKDAVLDLISSETIDNNINAALEEKQFNKAKNTLQIIKNYALATEEEITSWLAIIETREIAVKQEDNFATAEKYYSDSMFQQALPIYQALLTVGYKNSNLKARIQTCLEADPRFVQKKIKEAYNAVVKSKKNADATFKTYYKFQNSGQLDGSNYRFMCQMMLSKGNKRLLKEMSIPSSQAKNLAIKYFFKASNYGKDMTDIEYMIFTKNFNKN